MKRSLLLIIVTVLLAKAGMHLADTAIESVNTHHKEIATNA